MVGTPAYCNDCGKLFISSAISLGTGSRVQISNIVLDCPDCGKDAKLLDGVFEGAGDVLRLVSAPQLTVDVLNAFATLVDQTRQGKLSKVELHQKAAQLDEGLGAAVGELIRRYPKTMIALAFFVYLLKSANLETKLDLNTLFDQWANQVNVEEQIGKHSSATNRRKNMQEEQSSGNPEAAEQRSPQKQDRIRQQGSPSQTRRVKNKARRSALRRRRTDFNPKK